MMLEIGARNPRSWTEREMINRQLVKLFKCNLSIRSLSEISERLLPLCAQDLSSNSAGIKRHASLSFDDL